MRFGISLGIISLGAFNFFSKYTFSESYKMFSFGSNNSGQLGLGD